MQIYKNSFIKNVLSKFQLNVKYNNILYVFIDDIDLYEPMNTKIT